MVIDFHNHFFPIGYLNELRKGRTRATVERNSAGQLVMVQDGDYNVIVEEHHNPAARLAALAAAGVDRQCLSMTVPGVHSETAVTGLALAQLVNDGFAEVMAQYPDRYSALAALPLQDPAVAVKELERAVTQLGLRGGTLFTHINGRMLDEADFWPLYETAVALDVPLFIHPTIPHHIGSLAAYRLVAVAGFLFETTTAACRLVYSGVLERFAGLKLVLAHMGGTLPFIVERIDRGYDLYPECQGNLTRPPSELLQQLYVDTFPHAPQAIRMASDFFGPQRLLLGSDYPHQIGDLPGSVATIAKLPLATADKAKILGENAATLLKWTYH